MWHFWERSGVHEAIHRLQPGLTVRSERIGPQLIGACISAYKYAKSPKSTLSDPRFRICNQNRGDTNSVILLSGRTEPHRTEFSKSRNCDAGHQFSGLLIAWPRGRVVVHFKFRWLDLNLLTLSFTHTSSERYASGHRECCTCCIFSSFTRSINETDSH